MSYVQCACPHVPANLRRKALKLGKFLADVDKLRKLSTHSHMWVAQLVAAGGEVVYLFLEQVTWWADLLLGPSMFGGQLCFHNRCCQKPC